MKTREAYFPCMHSFCSIANIWPVLTMRAGGRRARRHFDADEAFNFPRRVRFLNTQRITASRRISSSP